MFANYLIGLREGLEAALIVSILLAYVVRTGHGSARVLIWRGVGYAVLLSIAVSAALQVTNNELGEPAGQVFEGLASLVAAVLVTFMIFWMAAKARTIKAHLESEVDKALAGAGALSLLAFVAVAREGLETALFLFATASATESQAAGVFAGLAGIATAVALGVAIFQGALRVNLRVWFRASGAVLVFVAAGLIAYGVHELTEAGWQPQTPYAIDITSVLSPDSGVAQILKGLFSFRPATAWAELSVWAAYALPVLWLFLRQSRTSAVAVR